MPIHDYQCKCGNTWEEYLDVRDDVAPKKCPVCGGMGQKLWTSPAIAKMDFRAGWDEGAGEYFDTKRQRDTFLDVHNLRRVRD